LILLAGSLAARRALRGAEPGWRRFRTDLEVMAHHEAGHATVAALLGRGVVYIDVFNRADLRRGGVCLHSSDPFRELSKDDLEKPSDSDYTQAVRLASLLAPEPGWLATLRTLHELKRRTEALIEANWRKVTALAYELGRRGSMGGKEIAPYLPAVIAVEMMPLLREEARKRQEATRGLPGHQIGDKVVPQTAPPSIAGKTHEIAANAVGVGKSIVQIASRVRDVDPEAFQRVKEGKTTVGLEASLAATSKPA
jgi:hypothetical protein